MVGDELGSRVVAGRQVREVMRHAFLLERSYAPHLKWLGTAFARLPSAADLTPLLERRLDATADADRESALVEAYELLARLHNRVAPTGHIDPAARPRAIYDG